jgi:aminomethyltransferase
MTFLRQTPYFSRQQALGATFVDRAGFAAAADYGSVRDEHFATRDAVGIFDVYYQVMIAITGAGARAWLDHLCVNDIARLAPGDVAYSAICTEDGGSIDDLTVFCFSETEFRLAPSPSRVAQVVAWLDARNGDGTITVTNLGYRDAYLSIQGPNARKLLQKLTDTDISNEGLKYFGFVTGRVADVPGVTISRTGYSGELGFELFYPSEYASHAWDRVMEAGADLGVRACGLAALVTLRTEKKFLLYGLDIDEKRNPIEAGLGWTLRKSKGDFIGRAALTRLKAQGTPEKLVLLAAKDLIPAFEIGSRIAIGDKAGVVTSASKGHYVGKSLAMGYVPAELAVEGAEAVIIGKSGEEHQVRLHLAPIYDPEGKRARA